MSLSQPAQKKSAAALQAGPRVRSAMSALLAGQVVGLPSETVYGLAARADDPSAIARLHRVKQSTASKPLSLCVLSKDHAKSVCQIGPHAERLMDKFWPGPLTLLLPKQSASPVHASANAGLDDIGVRCPNTKWRRAFLEHGFDLPLVFTSANFSGETAPVNLDQVDLALRSKIEIWLADEAPHNAPSVQSGLASTILSLHNDTASGVDAVMVRQGALARDGFSGFDLNWVLQHKDRPL